MAYRQDFGESVQKALAGRPYRQIAAKVRGAKISPSYIADMVQGRVPKRETLIAFGLACGLDVEGLNDLLITAGYDVLGDKDLGWEPNAALRTGLKVMQTIFAPIPLPLDDVPDDVTGYTEKQLDEITNKIEAKIRDKYGPLRLAIPADAPSADQIAAIGIPVVDVEEPTEQQRRRVVDDLLQRLGGRLRGAGATLDLAQVAAHSSGVPSGEPDDPSPKERWVDGLAALYQEFQRPIPVSFRGGIPATHEEVELELADIRKQLEEGLL